MTIAIYGSRRQAPYAPAIQRLINTLIDADINIVMHPKLYDHLAVELCLDLEDVQRGDYQYVDEEASVVLSIGGDGTFLRTAAWVADTEKPILGINTGHLGYLAALSIEDIDSLVNILQANEFWLSRRSLIAVDYPALKGWPYALNEVVIAKEDTASMISAHTLVDGGELALYRADGLIISTPTGSTAYNLSAGGSIIQPNAPVFAVTPIAAHSLSMRPLVVSDDVVLDIEVSGRSQAFRITIDGRSTTLPIGSNIRLKKADFCVVIVQRRGHAFPEILHDKLQWG